MYEANFLQLLLPETVGILGIQPSGSLPRPVGLKCMQTLSEQCLTSLGCYQVSFDVQLLHRMLAMSDANLGLSGSVGLTQSDKLDLAHCVLLSLKNAALDLLQKESIADSFLPKFLGTNMFKYFHHLHMI